jgi:hypothetical protein
VSSGRKALAYFVLVIGVLALGAATFLGIQALRNGTLMRSVYHISGRDGRGFAFFPTGIFPIVSSLLIFILLVVMVYLVISFIAALFRQPPPAVPPATPPPASAAPPEATPQPPSESVAPYTPLEDPYDRYV